MRKKQRKNSTVVSRVRNYLDIRDTELEKITGSLDRVNLELRKKIKDKKYMSNEEHKEYIKRVNRIMKNRKRK